jgi:hypothetical protein
MPWEKSGSGFTTKRGGHVKNPAQYEKLRGKGMSKERAARIVNKELRMKDPIEIMKADALWRRDDDIEKGIFGGLSQGIKRTQSMGPMTKHTQMGFNAGSKLRSAGSKVAGAFRRTGSQVKAGAQTPVGPMPASASRATKVGQTAGRAGLAAQKAPGRLVSAVKTNPASAIGIGAGGAGAAGIGGYGMGRKRQQRI